MEWSRSGALKFLLQRKRKNYGKSHSKLPNNPRSKLLRREDPPRPPSNISEHRFVWSEVLSEFSPEDRQHLDEMIHSEDQGLAEHETELLTVFGGLEKVGRAHYFLQERYDEGNGARKNIQFTEREMKRKLRKSILERLGPHQVERNNDPLKYRSKILRTVERYDTERKWLDFDLRHCLTEIAVGGSKRLCAFSTIEATVQDEDYESNSS